MVVTLQFAWLMLGQSSVTVQEQTSAQTLPEPVRQIAYMALLGIALLGMLMIVATLLGGHWVRRLGNRVRRSTLPDDVMIPRKENWRPPKLPQRATKDGETLGDADTTIS